MMDDGCYCVRNRYGACFQWRIGCSSGYDATCACRWSVIITTLLVGLLFAPAGVVLAVVCGSFFELLLYVSQFGQGFSCDCVLLVVGLGSLASRSCLLFVVNLSGILLRSRLLLVVNFRAALFWRLLLIVVNFSGGKRLFLIFRLDGMDLGMGIVMVSTIAVGYQ